MLIAGSFERVHKVLVHRQRSFVVNLGYLAFAQHTIQRCTLFIHKAVSGDMGGRKTDGSLHVSSPFVERLIGETEHKVDTYILNSSLFYNPNGINRLRRCVSTMKKLQSRVVESLNAHAYTVDAE